ncbi:MAG: hypothetical protein VX679_06620 [Pseudomonadota bacterium]|nr:hypothetical protein [Pseudomonadota bacterium]
MLYQYRPAACNRLSPDIQGYNASEESRQGKNGKLREPGTGKEVKSNESLRASTRRGVGDNPGLYALIDEHCIGGFLFATGFRPQPIMTTDFSPFPALLKLSA